MWYLLLANTTFAFTRQDSLRGGNGYGRNWWDVTAYDLHVKFDTVTKSISGRNTITMRVADFVSDKMQLDLQDPMILDSITWNGKHLYYLQEENVWWVAIPPGFGASGREAITAYYHGQPRQAKLPPWDGGFIWKQDSNGKPWITVACQGLGASSWWPCKDYQRDEPDNGVSMSFELPTGLKCISNGREVIKFQEGDAPEIKQGNTTTWQWGVKNPINTYNISFYIGDYVHWSDTMMGEKGKLDIGYYALRENEEKARKHFAVTKQMLHCFEYWMGPYPFYEDGYKLVEAPFLGMEHQSAVAYGNEYKMGYRGSDRSGTGVGTMFDFIIVHESGHEWFGNNITAADVADNWIHEGFTTYTEALFAECAFGKEKAFDYTRGEWKNIRNDKPVTGVYGVQDDGSGDKYDKGSALVHMVRMLINDDAKFREMLRGLNKDFYHQMVSVNQVEQYMGKYTSFNLKPMFNQYLRTANIPVLEYYIKDKELHYRFTDVVEGFTLPLEISSGKKKIQVSPTAEWQRTDWKKGGYDLSFSKDFLFKLKS